MSAVHDFIHGKNPTDLPRDMYALATGEVRPWIAASRRACTFIATQEGFVAIHPHPRGTLWMFDSLNHAKAARNAMEGMGMTVGRNITHFVTEEDGIPTAMDYV